MYIGLLLVGPSIFFVPKFFELQAIDVSFNLTKAYNCSSTDIPDQLLEVIGYRQRDLLSSNVPILQLPSTVIPSPTTADLLSLNEQNGSTDARSAMQEENSFCRRIFRFIKNVTTPDVLNTILNHKMLNNSLVHSSRKGMKMSYGDENVTLSFDVSTETVYVVRIKLKTILILDHTDLRKNPLYYKIYILGLTTLVTQIIPIGILVFFNIKIYTELKTNQATRAIYLDLKTPKRPL